MLDTRAMLDTLAMQETLALQESSLRKHVAESFTEIFCIQNATMLTNSDQIVIRIRLHYTGQSVLYILTDRVCNNEHYTGQSVLHILTDRVCNNEHYTGQSVLHILTDRVCNNEHYTGQSVLHILTDRVCNNETNEQMYSRNTGTIQDSNLQSSDKMLAL